MSSMLGRYKRQVLVPKVVEDTVLGSMVVGSLLETGICV